ncbi:phosphatase PAP2 family protein [Nocardia takedensis]|uniref:phosphatase PAP2 family protein n=1 Tax=Nocardia takedensis TaxID=259390 RepID=UPI000311E38E|nr:phosphatase PAP2 family protein [Nocardia takedensis]
MVDRRERETEADKHEEVVAAERFAAGSVAALLGVVAVGVGFGVLTALVRARWEPMQRLDQTVADHVVGVVGRNPPLGDILKSVTDLGATVTLLLMLAVATLWLLVRGLPRLALYVVLTSAGGLILNPIVKELVARLRPVVTDPVYVTDGWSFPSGHAMSSLVCYGAVVLVFAPALRERPRRVVFGLGVTIVVVVGLSRIALGVHYLTDVLAGWLLGILWLALTTVAFHRWRRDTREQAGPLPGDVAPDEREDLRPVPARHAPLLPHPWRGIGELAVAWVLLLGALVGLGLLIRTTDPGNPFLRWDHDLVEALVDDRTSTRTALLGVFGEIGNTTAVIAVALIVAALAVAILRTWRPVLFLVVAMVGEITLFLTSSAVVDRDRPKVLPLDPHLPPTASFPSGHVAAALTLYAAVALLIWTNTPRARHRIPATFLLLVPVLVATQRLYAGAHHPTDVLGSLLLTTIWLTAAYWIARPGPHPLRNPARTT